MSSSTHALWTSNVRFMGVMEGKGMAMEEKGRRGKKNNAVEVGGFEWVGPEEEIGGEVMGYESDGG